MQIDESDDDSRANDHADSRSDSIMELATSDSSRHNKNCKTGRQDKQQHRKIDKLPHDGKRQEPRSNNNRKPRQEQEHHDRGSNQSHVFYRLVTHRANHTVKTTVIIGDSMIKQIESKRLQRAVNGRLLV